MGRGAPHTREVHAPSLLRTQPQERIVGAGATVEAEASESTGEVGERGMVSTDGKDIVGVLEDDRGIAVGGWRPEGWGALTLARCALELDACVNANS